MDVDQLNRLRILLLAVLLLIVVGGVTDLAMDRPESWLSVHVLFEASLIGGALVLALVLWAGWWRAEKTAGQLRSTLQEQETERDAWRRSARKALEGLGEAIHNQFMEWDLSDAEQEVALLLMKGRSHKAIAKQTGRSPQTARQHASAVYRKSGLAGRAELAAFFLEDLMLPDGEVEEAISEGG